MKHLGKIVKSRQDSHIKYASGIDERGCATLLSTLFKDTGSHLNRTCPGIGWVKLQAIASFTLFNRIRSQSQHPGPYSGWVKSVSWSRGKRGLRGEASKVFEGVLRYKSISLFIRLDVFLQRLMAVSPEQFILKRINGEVIPEWLRIEKRLQLFE